MTSVAGVPLSKLYAHATGGALVWASYPLYSCSHIGSLAVLTSVPEKKTSLIRKQDWQKKDYGSTVDRQELAGYQPDGFQALTHAKLPVAGAIPIRAD